MTDPEPPRKPGMRHLTLAILLFVVGGAPLVAFLWERLNELLSGYFNGTRLLLAIPAALVLATLLFYMKRVVIRWEERREVSRTTHPAGGLDATDR